MRYCACRVEVVRTVQVLAVEPDTPAAAVKVDSACGRSGLSTVNSGWPFFTSSPTSARRGNHTALIGCEDLHRLVLIEVDAADGLLLERKAAFLDPCDFDRTDCGSKRCALSGPGLAAPGALGSPAPPADFYDRLDAGPNR